MDTDGETNMDNKKGNSNDSKKQSNEVKNGHNNSTISVIDGVFSANSSSKAKLPVVPHPDAEIYAKHRNRGTAIIFNHKYFDMECSTRDGTDKDRDDIECVLKELKFDVKTYNDLTYEETMEVLEVVSKMDHSDSECLIIAVMSHGEENIIYAKDRPYPTKKLWIKFSPLHCGSLAGKPKLFFIQACRGSKTDPGAEVSYIETDSKKAQEPIYSIPVMADILVMYATVEDYYAWRDPKNGSYFIQALVKQFRKNHESKDLLSILTCVNREVAIGFTSTSPEYPHFNRKKEMCSIVSMLTRSYYFNL